MRITARNKPICELEHLTLEAIGGQGFVTGLKVRASGVGAVTGAEGWKSEEGLHD